MTRLIRLVLLWAVAVAVTTGGIVAVRPASAAPGIRILFRTGESAPDGGTYAEFSDPVINNRGDILFGAVLAGARPRETIYVRTGSGLRPLASTGTSVPTGGVFRAFSDLLLNDRGTVGFLARTTDARAPEGIYLVRGSRVVPVVTVGQAAPTGGAFADFANPAINNRDLIAFVGRTVGQEGIYTNSEGTTTPVLMAGQPSPTGGAFEFFLDGTPALNDRGQMALVASTTEHHAQGVFVLVDGRPVPVVTTEDDAPVGGRFTEFGSVVLTNAGTVGFIGRTGRSQVAEALYVTGRAALLPLAVAGQDVAGGALTKFGTAAINEREEMVFELSLPIIPQAVYVATRAGVRPIVQTGDRAPGGGLFAAFSTPVLNDAGQVAFVAETDDGRHGIYLLALR
ncbi:MAG TPA: choice-of-anchor tandem repeat NxxGxxAF-containing protein [bacterium]|nr:choice-of-anchor tandem repeat NxxGxxAF-containing protein [bacterium]